MQISCAFVFATLIAQSFYFLNRKFQASSHLVWSYSLNCVGRGWNPEDRFSHKAPHIVFAVCAPGQPASTPEAVEMERERTCQNMEGLFNSLIRIYFTMCHMTSKLTMDLKQQIKK